jgi:hypothetical protein
MERDRNAGTVVPVVGADAQALAGCKAQCRSGREHRVVCAVTIAELTPQLMPERPRGQLERPHAESHVRTGRPNLQVTSRSQCRRRPRRGRPGPGGRRVLLQYTP